VPEAPLRFNQRAVQHKDSSGFDGPILNAAQTGDCCYAEAMFNLVSLIIGFVALILALVAFIPFLGIGEWLVLLLAICGAGIGVISRSNAGRNLNIFVILVAVVRLILGHGFL
jgi:hypothetical protein